MERCNDHAIHNAEDKLIEKLNELFPGSYYTLFVTKWNDGTFMVELRHGRPLVGETHDLYVWRWYDGEITHEVKTVPTQMGTA